MTYVPNYSGPKEDANPSDLGKYEGNGWVLEPKMDGMWIEFRVGQDGNTILSRRGIAPESAYTSEFLDVKLPLPPGTILIGELEAGTDRATKSKQNFHPIWFHDIIQLGDSDMRGQDLGSRRTFLEDLFNEIEFCTMHLPGRFRLTPMFSSLFEQRYTSFVNNGGEGVVLKKLKAPYVSGKNMNSVRVKDTTTDDFVLMELGKTDGGDTTGVWGQYHNGTLIYVMRAQPLRNMSILTQDNCGSLVAEFKGWGHQSSGTLRSAQFERVRTDKPKEDCVLNNIGDKTPTRKK